MVTLRQLQYLDALAREGHFGHAAEASGVTQAALSMQIRKLEAVLGTPLVERTTRGHSLTPAGVEAARRARGILASTEDLREYAAQVGRSMRGTLRLGIIPTVAPYLLPAALPILRERFPDLAFEVREARTSTLVEELEGGTLDLLLLSLPIEGEGIETHVLFRDPFRLAIETDPSRRARRRVSTEALASMRLLLLSDGHCLRDQALQVCRLAHREVMEQLGATSLATLLQLVANGMGVTLLPEMAISAEVRDPRITLLRFKDPEPSREIGLAWRRSSPHGERFRAIAEVILEARRISRRSHA